ncbi:S-adenosyl-L-methionine-dependent methyltransferase [Lasiosphaeria miniovina]|uniref:Protein arginine methyltransferase NDUFAF7 n=1 Tax=Lasiosphaeria miniovina TaxID=1954250 RepID=A0AA40BGI6_9PEZI|nr:S-adenosyl-L-methionine-dependent methyltransferase [Lasiosphaeria miniovina]KAK0733523.1 S-adenosyl-L-methionine-dependent methyltransferase [Lasiosphaeria miniovina]
MDSPVVTQLFRQLFRQHPACQNLNLNLNQSAKHLARLATCSSAAALSPHHVRRRQPCFHHHQQRRSLWTPGSGWKRGSGPAIQRNESNWQQRTALLQRDMTDEYKHFPMVTAKELRGRRERPRRVKMFMRDFIEDSLYNPHYGYFSQQVVIFSPGEPFEFPNLRDEMEFHELLSKRYRAFEDRLDEAAPSDTRQLWYTPTELFRPYYGEAIARYLVDNYKLTTYPYDDLIIYEMGAGRGTLMLNILDYIRDMDPDVYARTQYKIIEISSKLAGVQDSQLKQSAARWHSSSPVAAAAGNRGHIGKVEIINQSIFDWSHVVPSPCFFLAFEVFDNFAHDVLRYDLETEAPLQGTVLIDDSGDFFEFYVPVLDPTVAHFLKVRHLATSGRYKLPYPASRLGRWFAANRPGAPNLSNPEYVPTRLMQFFEVLDKYFPAHRLVTSDFHSLPNALPGLNAPIVQTRYQRRPVPVTTPLVHQGYFDIMFPTDFHRAEAIYQAITGKLTRVLSHEEFMRRWAYLEETETQTGENPLLSWYKNASVLTTL